ncbi:hypothetical protein TRICHSKD4_0777 [Roseibium sp. TrichSKD4]|nr:hypothetical protein TRICHSKD4_0777 [Roseibium sp. TrichSKD4]
MQAPLIETMRISFSRKTYHHIFVRSARSCGVVETTKGA